MKSRGGLEREVLSHLSSSLAFIFSRSFLLRTAPHSHLSPLSERLEQATRFLFVCSFFFLAILAWEKANCGDKYEEI